jgi:hypothetical protein
MGKNFIKHPGDQGGERRIILLLTDIGTDNVNLTELAEYSVQWLKLLLGKLYID